MKLNLELGVSQHLTMTPQLQQAIRLLQLSTLELELEIRQAVESNPLLEIDDEDGAEDPVGEDAPLVTHAIAERLDLSDQPIDLASSENMPDDLPVDGEWQDSFAEMSYESETQASSVGAPDSEMPDFETRANRPETLIDHLIWQMELTPFTPRDLRIAETIIDAIDENGYLKTTLEELRTGLPPEDEVGLDEITTVLHRVQNFDPAGVGARDLGECLRIQLRQLPTNLPGLTAALRVVEHLELLGEREFRQVARAADVTDDELRLAIGLIQSLDPHPGSTITQADPEYIVPDVLVRRRNGAWAVDLNPAIAPKLRINNYYSGMIKRRDNSATNTYLKTQLNEARWFIGSLRSRNETLLRVAECIVRRQVAFFDQGAQAMKPMVLHDVAEELGLHESTISRVTNKKYMHAPNAIHELKYFFSSHVGTADGGAASATSIRAQLRELIDAEDKAFSDAKLASILKNRGINVARRTVAKYREAMRIPPSNERKKTVVALDVGHSDPADTP